MNSLLTPTNKEIIVVDVPKDAHGFQITYHQIDKKPQLSYYENEYNVPFINSELPAGQYTILGRLSELSEEQWKDLIAYHAPFVDYGEINILDENYTGLWLQTAKESGISFLISKRIDIATNPLIILKNN